MMSVLIDETLSDYQANYPQEAAESNNDRGLQSDDQWEEERMEFTTNDSNITKDRHYVAWKEKAKAAKQEAEAVKEENSALKRERTKTVEHVHSLKKKVEELESVKNTEITAYESQIENAKLQIDKFKRKHEESERIRKDSISTLHENLFSKLLEAEAEHEEMVGDYKKSIEDLQGRNHDLQTTIKAMGMQKVETVVSLEGMMQQLRENVLALSKQNQHLQSRMRQI